MLTMRSLGFLVALVATLSGAAFAQDQDAPKATLREHIEHELTTANKELAERKAAKEYGEAALAQETVSQLTVSLSYVSSLTARLTAAEGAADFTTCTAIDSEMKSVSRDRVGMLAFYEVAAREESKREAKEAANKVLDKGGNTGLHVAVRSSDAEGARKLIEQGANPDIVNLEGTTPLMLAARKGRVEVASVLVSAGANKALADRGSKNALMWAAEENHLEVARLLVDEGATDKADRTYWRTQLMWAAEEGHTEVAKMLIDAGSGKLDDGHGSAAAKAKAAAEAQAAAQAKAHAAVIAAAEKRRVDLDNERRAESARELELER